MSNRWFRPIALAAILAAAASAVLAKDVNIKQIITAGHQKWEQAVLAGDAKTVATLYAMKGSILPPNAPQADGRAAIEQYFATMGKTHVTIAITETKLMGSMAWSTGTYTILGADKKTVVDAGKYLEVWAETEDGWKIYKDIWNSDRPAPAPAPSAPAPAVKK